MFLQVIMFLLFSVTTHSTLEIPESSGERVECLRSKIDHNVTLSDGHNAGSFLKSNKSITTMDKCVEQCCKMHECDVAFFSNGACYSVICKNIQSCAPSVNLDRRMKIAISYVAKPHTTTNKKDQIVDKNGEPAITDNLISEVTKESPFLLDDMNDELENDSDQQLVRARRENWRETKDMIVAIGCGFVAVAVGVIGVIMMTRQLVEDDDIVIDYGEPTACKPAITENQDLTSAFNISNEKRNILEKINTSRNKN